jgi:hypothetical protein
MVKRLELEKIVPDDKPFPDLFAAQQAAAEDYIDALVARRRANAGGDEDANKAAAQALDAARHRGVAATIRYRDAVEAISRH